MPKQTENDEPTKMTIFIKPSVIERLRVESRAESRVPGRHAGIVIERYLDEKYGNVTGNVNDLIYSKKNEVTDGE